MEAKLNESEQRRATLEAENAALRGVAEAGNAITATQGESFKVISEGKLQLEAKNARLEEDIRRHAEDRREDKMKIASFNEEKAQRMSEIKQLQQELREEKQETKSLAQSLTDLTMSQELIKKRAETVDEDRMLMEKKLESKDQDRSQLERDLVGVKAQLRTQQLEYEAREEKIREMYEDALDEKEECEIRTKEHELKVFLLEEQLRADGQMPLTHLPEALTPDNSEEMDALRKSLKKVTAVRNSAMQRAEYAETEVQKLENDVARMKAHAKGDPTEMGKLSSKVERVLEESDKLKVEKVSSLSDTLSACLGSVATTSHAPNFSVV
jgi:chromosome segregation ATPase